MAAQRDEKGRFQARSQGACDASVNVPVAGEGEVEAPASEAFLRELQASWERHGAETIETVRCARPHDYLRLIAASLAKQADAVEAMSEDEIIDELRRLLGQLAAAGVDLGP